MVTTETRKIQCSKCNIQMKFIRKLDFKCSGMIMPTLIPIGAILGSEKTLTVDVYFCVKCGKVELYGPDESNELGQLKFIYGTAIPKNMQLKCSFCGKLIVAGLKMCPFCGSDQPYIDKK